MKIQIVGWDVSWWWMVCSIGAVEYVGNGANVDVGPIDDQVVVNWRHIVCHIDVKYGQEKLLPDNSISRINVSMGVLPTKRTKNNCSMTCDKGEVNIHKINENHLYTVPLAKGVEAYSIFHCPQLKLLQRNRNETYLRWNGPQWR